MTEESFTLKIMNDIDIGNGDPIVLLGHKEDDSYETIFLGTGFTSHNDLFNKLVSVKHGCNVIDIMDEQAEKIRECNDFTVMCSSACIYSNGEIDD